MAQGQDRLEEDLADSLLNVCQTERLDQPLLMQVSVEIEKDWAGLCTSRTCPSVSVSPSRQICGGSLENGRSFMVGDRD